MRYLSPAQMWYRGVRIVLRRWWRLTLKPIPSPTVWIDKVTVPLYKGLVDCASPGPWADEVQDACHQASAIAQSRFNFLNHEIVFDGPPDWHTLKASHLWRFHLHYFDYVRDLLIWASVGYAEKAYATFRNLAISWIDAHQTIDGDGWHSYTLSLRIVNWLNAIDGFASQLQQDPEFRSLLLGSIYAQTQIVFIDQEKDVRGNHLLENIRALLWAGVVFEGSEPDRWFSYAMDLLHYEIEEQILSDGGHFERTPSYHVLILRDILEVAIFLKRNQYQIPDWLNAAILRMLEYLLAIIPPDGKMPLVKDTTWDTTTPNPQDILTVGALYFHNTLYKRSNHVGIYPLLLYGTEAINAFQLWMINEKHCPSQLLPASGFAVIRHDPDRDYLIFDVGKPCPDYLPAHAHADLLSYELLVGGERLIVDSGVYEYTAGLWRDYFRSTRAHNTIELNGTDQSEVWASFRIGRRARPGPVLWQEEATFILVQGEHDGYRFLPARAIHQRTIFYLKARCWVVVDTIWGNQLVTLASYLHLNPKVSLSLLTETYEIAPERSDNATWSIHGMQTPLWLSTFGNLQHNQIYGSLEPVTQGWYSEQFGQMVCNTTLQLKKQTNLPACCGYAISRHTPVHVHIVVVRGGYHIYIRCGDKWHTLEIHQNAS